jgi:hypothetical protein
MAQTAGEETFAGTGGLSIFFRSWRPEESPHSPGFALAAIKGLSHVAPRLPVLTLKNEDFSRDPHAVAALVRADERLREEFPRVTLPVLGVMADIQAWIDKRVAS